MEAREFKIGEHVSAAFMTELVQTVSKAEENAKLASEVSDEAKRNSGDAMNCATEALEQSRIAVSNMVDAGQRAQIALDKANALELRINGGELNGKDGIVVAQSGFVGFSIENGDLIAHYDGEQEPSFSLNENGELIYNY